MIDIVNVWISSGADKSKDDNDESERERGTCDLNTFSKKWFFH